MLKPAIPSHAPPEQAERWATLAALEDWLETRMLVLSILWLVMVVYELAAGSSQLLETFGTVV